MGTPTGGPEDEFVFDEDFVSGATFKEQAPVKVGRFAAWRRRRALKRYALGDRPKVTRLPGRRARLLRLNAQTLTILIVLARVAAAVFLDRVIDPMHLHGP